MKLCKMVDAYSTQAQQAVRGASRDVPRRVRSRLKRALAPLSVADDAPIYLRDNQFIRDYYRVNFSTKDTWRSLFRIHNETGNIWSHLVGDCRRPELVGSYLSLDLIAPMHMLGIASQGS